MARGRGKKGRGRDHCHSAATRRRALPHVHALTDPFLKNSPPANLLGLFLNIQHVIEDSVGHFEFGSAWAARFPGRRGNTKSRCSYRCRSRRLPCHVVGDDHVRVLALELAARILRHGIRLCGEADEHLLARASAAELRQNIRFGSSSSVNPPSPRLIFLSCCTAAR